MTDADSAEPPDLLVRLAELADDLGPLAVPTDWRDQLAEVCRTAQLVLGAAAVSVARVDERSETSSDPNGAGADLVYVAASGEGAGQIVGTRLTAGTGIAGFVAASGQALAVDRVSEDPRFAHDVAESTGYVPETLLVVPITSSDGTPLGVLSLLDRANDAGSSTTVALEVASAFARQASSLLTRIDQLVGFGPILVGALVDAVAERDPDLGDGLRRAAEQLPGPDRELASTAALLAELRTRGPGTRASVERVLAELLQLSAPRRRR